MVLQQFKLATGKSLLSTCNAAPSQRHLDVKSPCYVRGWYSFMRDSFLNSLYSLYYARQLVKGITNRLLVWGSLYSYQNIFLDNAVCSFYMRHHDKCFLLWTLGTLMGQEGCTPTSKILSSPIVWHLVSHWTQYIECVVERLKECILLRRKVSNKLRIVDRLTWKRTGMNNHMYPLFFFMMAQK